MSDWLITVVAVAVVCGLWYYIANGLPSIRNRPKGPPTSKAESLKDRRID